MQVFVKDYSLGLIVDELKSLKESSYVVVGEVYEIIDKLLRLENGEVECANAINDEALEGVAMTIVEHMSAKIETLSDISVYNTPAVWYASELGCIYSNVRCEIEHLHELTLVIPASKKLAKDLLQKVYSGKQENFYTCLRYDSDDYDDSLLEVLEIKFAKLAIAVDRLL